jgi:hypothetical protein
MQREQSQSLYTIFNITGFGLWSLFHPPAVIFCEYGLSIVAIVGVWQGAKDVLLVCLISYI